MKNVTTQSSRGEENFGHKVIKDAEALSPTSSSIGNGGYMMTIQDIGMDVTKEKSVK